MTISEMQKLSKAFLNAADIAPVLNCDPQCIRAQAHIDPSKLGYPVIVTGRRIRIPRIPFLEYLGLL